jgi:molybdenum cofactor cytidylyltransferase
MGDKERKSGVSAVVLAAGMSLRMGMPKQLLPIDGKTILERTLQNVRASNVDEIVLVLGHAAESIEKTIAAADLKLVRNPDYQQGMGTSLRAGLTAVHADAQAALIILADQPWVSSETLDRLIACQHDSKQQIIIPMYRGFRGNPVLLDRSVFPEVQALDGDAGCREIFGNHTENILKLAVDDPGILLDIDNRDDLEKLDANVKRDPAPNHSEPGIIVLETRENIVAGPLELVLVGRDALVRALVRFGRVLNFNITIVDPFLGLIEFPEADRMLHVLDFSLLPSASERYAVVASRGQFDEEAVTQALKADCSYIALLANKKRAQEVVKSLRGQSIAPEKLASVHAPAGLEIGAQTPEEIALSIMAQIVAVRHG